MVCDEVSAHRTPEETRYRVVHLGLKSRLASLFAPVFCTYYKCTINYLYLTTTLCIMMKNFNPDEWLSIMNAARLRGVSRQAMDSLVRKGRFETLKISGVIFIRKKEVEAYRPVNTGRPRKQPE